MRTETCILRVRLEDGQQFDRRIHSSGVPMFELGRAGVPWVSARGNARSLAEQMMVYGYWDGDELKRVCGAAVVLDGNAE